MTSPAPDRALSHLAPRTQSCHPEEFASGGPEGYALALNVAPACPEGRETNRGFALTCPDLRGSFEGGPQPGSPFLALSGGFVLSRMRPCRSLVAQGAATCFSVAGPGAFPIREFCSSGRPSTTYAGRLTKPANAQDALVVRSRRFSPNAAKPPDRRSFVN